MLTGFQVYKYYVGLKSHFEGKYDFIKYGGKTKVSIGSYESRNDRVMFERIANKVASNEIVPFLVANIMSGDNLWIGDITSDFDKAKDAFNKWHKKMVWLYKNYEDDLDNICRFVEEKNLAIKDLFMYNNGNHPAIFRFMLEGMIEKETFIILDDIIGFVELNNKYLKGDIIWDNEIAKLHQYKPFIMYDKGRCENITKLKFNNTA